MNVSQKKLTFGPRRGFYLDVNDIETKSTLSQKELEYLEKFNSLYRSLCGVLFNFVPKSGHPGGSISAGRIIENLIFSTMDYNFSDPNSTCADVISLGAGHKATGVYAMWALRNEMVRITDPKMLPSENKQLRLEDLLGFRRNPCTKTPLFVEYKAKALDGHTTPTTPFIRLSTGASGIGDASSIGLGFALLDSFSENFPFIHIIEGEGGLTTGRAAEATAAAGTASLKNVIMHLDWNQAGIDADAICRDGSKPGEYVQWDPREFFYLYDWNVIYLSDGFSYTDIYKAQDFAVKQKENNQPTAIVYKTVKGWKYGITGSKSHGSGHEFCSPEYYNFLKECETTFNIHMPRFAGEKNEAAVEKALYDTLLVYRKTLEANKDMSLFFTERLKISKKRLESLKRENYHKPYDLKIIDNQALMNSQETPKELDLAPDTKIALRETLGNVLNYINKKTNGGLVAASADLFASTGVKKIAQGLSEGLYNFTTNRNARLIAVGGICEDGIGGFMTGVSTYGNHIGVSASFAAFVVPMEHTALRLHCIAQQAKHDVGENKKNTMMIVCGHAGMETGEDGPTHADPQVLQLISENFPRGHVITLTPWDSRELWPLIMYGLQKHPSVLAPFVTRPTEKIIDRKKYNLADINETLTGMYRLRKHDSKKEYHGAIVLQGSGIANAFVSETLPKLDNDGINVDVFYVSSLELFDSLSKEEQNKMYPEKTANLAMGITGFTLPTMYRWIQSSFGRDHTLYPFLKGHFLGSGPGHKVIEEAGLNGEAQYKAIIEYIEKRKRHT